MNLSPPANDNPEADELGLLVHEMRSIVSKLKTLTLRQKLLEEPLNRQVIMEEAYDLARFIHNINVDLYHGDRQLVLFDDYG